MSSAPPNRLAPVRLALGSRSAREAALVDRIAAWRQADPFVPITVLVPNGETADRVHELVAAAGAVLGVEARTLEQQATRRVERAGPRGGLGLPPGGAQLVVRRLLAGDGAPPALAALADRPGLLDATGAALRDLLDAGLGPCDRVGPLGGLHDAHLALRAELDLVDDSDRFARAAAACAAEPAERLVLHGLYDPTGLQERLVAAELAVATDAVVLAAPHGRPLLERLEANLAERGSERVALAEPTAAVGGAADGAAGGAADGAADGADGGATDGAAGCVTGDGGQTGRPDVLSLPAGLAGARLLAVHLRDLLADGDLAPADLAVVHRGSGGVPSDLLARELDALGVPVAAGRTLGGTAPGPFLLALGRLLAGARVSRAALLDALALAPGVDPADLARWDRLGRDAGLRLVLDGGEALATALGRLTYQAHRLEDAQGEPAARRDSLPALVRILKDLDALHRGLHGGRPWGAFGRRLTAVLDGTGLLDGADPAARAAWAEHLGALAGLERLSRAADPLAFGRVLSDVAARSLPDGAVAGVTLAPLARCRGGRWRRVVLLDADERCFPREAPPDPLLDEGTRAGLADRAPHLVHDVDAEERALLAELLDLAAEGVALCTTRPGIEGKACPGPSRFVLELLADPEPPNLEQVTAGTAPGMTRLDLAGLWTAAPGAGPAAAPDRQHAALFAAGLGLEPAALRDLLRRLPDAPDTSGASDASGPSDASGASDASDASDDSGASRSSAAARAALETARLDHPGATAFDGHLTGTAAHADLVAAGAFRGQGRALSASTLERYAGCGMRSLLERWLGLDEHEDPDARRGLDARDRGQAVHDILEAFGRATIDAGLVPWRRADLDVLRGHLATAIDAVLERIRRGVADPDRPLWEAEGERYRGLLGRWLQEQVGPDGADAPWVPAAVEWAFDEEPYRLPDGRRLLLAGRVDRVDRSADGTAVRVVDYKTGKVPQATPGTTGGGRRLQAHLYGVAARRHHDARTSEGLYDHVLVAGSLGWDGIDRERGRRPGLRVEGDGAAAREVAALVDGMEAGHFEPLPRADRKVDDNACSTCGMAEACGPWRDGARTALEDAGHPVLAALEDAVDLRHLDGAAPDSGGTP